MKTDNLVLLITGCIDPYPYQLFHSLKDPKERLEQYIESIQFYIKETNLKKIVYCDNSNFYDSRIIDDLNCLASANGKLFEWIAFQGNEIENAKRNKGYGEGEIIDYALQHSALLKEAKQFCKVTGRLKVLNIDKALSGIKESGKYFNRDIIYGCKWIDTRFYCCETVFYNCYLRLLYLDVQRSVTIESLFWRVLKNRRDWRSTFAFPLIEGVSGFTGQPYDKYRKIVSEFLNCSCKLNIYNQLVIPLYLDCRYISFAFLRHVQHHTG